MYKQFWNLESKPFENRVSTSLYFATASHKSSESKIRYVLESRLPAALLTGGAGVGKTTLLRVLEERYRGDIAFHQIQFPQLPPDQLLACIAARLSHSPHVSGRAPTENLRCIEEQLIQCEADNQHVCIVVDECHGLPHESFETLRLLLNLAEPLGAHLTLLLAGQPSVRKALQVQPQFEERLAVQLNLAKLDADETVAYIQHRMRAAGAIQEIFTPDAFEAIYHASQGVPGRINRLCDMALLVGFGEDCSTIDGRQIQAVDRGLFTMPWAA